MTRRLWMIWTCSFVAVVLAWAGCPTEDTDAGDDDTDVADDDDATDGDDDTGDADDDTTSDDDDTAGDDDDDTAAGLEIDFAGSGAATDVDAVEVLNLSNCDWTTVKGDQSLDLSADLDFADGDRLKLTGYSGVYTTVLTVEPTSSTTYTFEFMACADHDGNHYAVVPIGSQWWMAENLRSEHYADGTAVAESYDDGANYLATYGPAYPWHVVMGGEASSDANPSGIQGICPDGWHVPSDAEWTELTDHLGSDAGRKLKAVCSDLWMEGNDASNQSGFTLLPGGGCSEGSFHKVGESGHGWSTTEDTADTANAWLRGFNYAVSGANRYASDKTSALHVRCVADAP